MRCLSLTMAILILLSSGCDDVKVAQGKIKPNLASAPPQEAEDASKSGSVDTQGPTAAKPRPARFEKEEETPAEKDPPIPEGAKPLNKNKTLYFETLKDGTRRVHLLSTVVLREGPLEVFLCKYQTKEHESIVDCDVDAREVHMALVAAKAVPGTPVKFSPKYTPATGSRIKVTMTYYFNGKLLNKDARYWIKDVRNKKNWPTTGYSPVAGWKTIPTIPRKSTTTPTTARLSASRIFPIPCWISPSKARIKITS